MKRELYTPLNAALRAGCEENDAPVRRFTPPKVERTTVQEAPEAWFPLFFAAAHFRIAATVLFLTTTGARVSEACRLTVEDCNLATGKALLRTTKSGKARVVALTDVACRAIAALVEADGLAPSDPVFGYAARWSSGGIRSPLDGWRTGNHSGVCKRLLVEALQLLRVGSFHPARHGDVQACKERIRKRLGVVA